MCAGAAHLGHPEKEEWSAKSAQRQQLHLVMRQVPLECDINIAVNGCSGYASSIRKGPFMAMLISHFRATCLITLGFEMVIWT